ncbi:uncharacterized protein [Venturia canescens]|uniref:uncharacterized protein n=1 Tax=Venturia canescens TaxID=32260 RepID=UPI001C9BCB14|nr:uncharacterized protein LOC122417825 [Venturia canescens]
MARELREKGCGFVRPYSWFCAGKRAEKSEEEKEREREDRLEPSMELGANDEKAARSKIVKRLDWLLEKWRGRHTHRCQYQKRRKESRRWNYSSGLIGSYDTKKCYIRNWYRIRKIGNWRREMRDRSRACQEERDKKRQLIITKIG